MRNSREEQTSLVKPLHVGISVPDLDAAVEWYCSMLEFRLVSDRYFDQIPARIAFIEHGGFSIELFEVDGAAPLPEDRRIPNLDIRTHGIKHVAYCVQDLHSLMDTLRAKGVDIAMDIFPMDGDWVAFIRDNTGNLIELIEEQGHQE
jgi:methylmalonyl-CoA/ethylmalonyl-CoA epimerase